MIMQCTAGQYTSLTALMSRRVLSYDPVQNLHSLLSLPRKGDSPAAAAAADAPAAAAAEEAAAAAAAAPPPAVLHQRHARQVKRPLSLLMCRVTGEGVTHGTSCSCVFPNVGAEHR